MEELTPCKHLIFDESKYPHLKLVNLCVANFPGAIKAWKRKDRGCDGSYYCQFCDMGSRRMPYAAMCYGDRECYEALEEAK